LVGPFATTTTTAITTATKKDHKCLSEGPKDTILKKQER